MPSYPSSRDAFALWAQAHAPVFSANAAGIGLLPAQSASFDAASKALTQSITDQAAALAAAKKATENANDNFRTCRDLASNFVAVIRAYARTHNEQAVLTLAQLSQPLPPSPQAAPTQPTNFAAQLNPGGSLTLKWKCDGGTGTSYIIRRKVGSGGPWIFVGAIGTKKFTDAQIPAGASSVTYTVQGTRGQAAGPQSIEQTFSFGVGSNGEAFVTAVSGAKMAA